MIGDIIFGVFLVVFPYLILRGTLKYSFLEKIGTVVLCFFSGLILSFTGLISENGAQIQEIIMNLSVLIALPLLLFGRDVKQFKNLAGKTILSLFLGLLSLVIILVIAKIIWQNKIDNFSKLSGLLVGLYTGGTPNLAALQVALEVDPATYLIVNTYDLFFGAIYLLFMMTFGKVLFRFILPKFKKSLNNKEFEEIEYNERAKDPFSFKNLKTTTKSLFLSLFIATFSAVISFLITGKLSMLLLILVLTSLSLFAGTRKSVKKLDKSFDLGMYFILVFSIALASMVRTEMFYNLNQYIFFFVGFTVLGTFFLHAIFSSIFRIDRDTTFVTSTALICSPPFVPMIANSLNNKEIILPGISVGLIGYAIGNYLGVTIFWIFENIL